MRVLTIVPDEALRSQLSEALKHISSLTRVGSLTSFPDPDELQRSIRIQKPDFLIVWVQDGPSVEALLSSLNDVMPGLPIVGVAQHIDEAPTHRLMRLGIREYLTPPFTQARLIEIADFLGKQLDRHPRPSARAADLYTFFPAKPGVGCTTIALSASCALAEELSTRTLLLDCDLGAGIIGFHLKLGNSGSIVDALRHAENLDADLWRQMVGKWNKLEVLHAGKLMSTPNVGSAALERVLALARAQYDVICADVGSCLDELSIALLRESQRIFLVTTPEVAAVHLAQLRMTSLNDLGVTDRVSLVLNRKDQWRGHLNADMVAQAVGIPVAYSIGNDYLTCSEAVVKGPSIQGESDIGRSMLNLAQALRHDTSQQAIPAGPGRKFLEFFHVSHIEDPTTVWRD
jgi:pilus assembly protein CpaE